MRAYNLKLIYLRLQIITMYILSMRYINICKTVKKYKKRVKLTD